MADVVPAAEGPTAAGTTWTDVTRVPGVRPRMRTLRSVPDAVWTEQGTWGPFRATLTLAFAEQGAGSLVRATFHVHGAGLGPLLTVLGRVAVTADLRRAARLLGSPGGS